MSNVYSVTNVRGLSQAEVAQRVRIGKVNVNCDLPTKTIPQILADHTFTLFNAVMVFLAILTLTTGRVTNVMFVMPVFANLVIGAFQEVRSKRAIDKLQVVSARPVRVIRDGVETSVRVEEIVLDDVVKLGRGDQVPADLMVIAGEAHVDESLITGESVSIAKSVGDELISGSFLESGTVTCRVIRVGAEGYAARLNSGARYTRGSHSEIVEALDDIIRLITFLLAPLGILLYWRTLSSGTGTTESILTTVSAIVNMIPEGLILLTSSVFALAATRLASHNVLVQQIYSIEILARVDVLCLDKTGTITSGSMEVTSVVPADGVSPLVLDAALAALIESAGEDLNETSRAIRDYVVQRRLRSEAIAQTIAFTSATKRSGCVTRSGAAYLMGAAPFVLHEVSPYVHARLRGFGSMARVLVVAACDGFDTNAGIVGRARLLGYVALQDSIRPTAADTVRYFNECGVRLNVISGDDPATVSAIAQRVGILGAEHYVDATTLKTAVDLRRAAEKYRVFGRVTPDQKRSLVRAFRYAGHTVAMMGDGVNDVLALREADCSVAVSSGSDVARNVADLVLVDDDFAHMPEVVSEGRKSINNLQRSASLFLVKTVFTMLLALICAVWPPYPFLPIQSTLISTAVIGVPSLILAVEPNRERLQGHFLVNVFVRSLPASFGIVGGLVAVLVISRLFSIHTEQTSTMCMYVVSCVGYLLIATVSVPLTPLRTSVLFIVLAIMIAGCTTLSDLFEVASLGIGQIVVTLLGCAVGIVVYVFFYRRVTKGSAEDGPIGSLVRAIGGSHASRRNIPAVRRVQEIGTSVKGWAGRMLNRWHR